MSGGEPITQRLCEERCLALKDAVGRIESSTDVLTDTTADLTTSVAVLSGKVDALPAAIRLAILEHDAAVRRRASWRPKDVKDLLRYAAILAALLSGGAGGAAVFRALGG